MNPKLAELISMNDGELPSFITEDFYPIYYLTRKGEILCPTCANLVLKGKAKGQIIADDLEDYKINEQGRNRYHSITLHFKQNTEHKNNIK